MLNFEQLSPAEQEQINGILKISGSPAAVTGVLDSSRDWDQRPVIFARGKLWVVRITAPELDQDHLAIVRGLLRWSCQHSPPQSGVLGGWGQSGSQLWFRRRYEEQTLLDLIGNRSEGPIFWWSYLQQLVARVRELHAAGNVHGHICPSNIAPEGNKLRLIDAGLGVAAIPGRIDEPWLTSNWYAPELVDPDRRKRMSDVTDIYGIGRIAEWLDQAGLIVVRHSTEELQELLASCTNANPYDRPSLAKLSLAIDTLIKSSGDRASEMSSSINQVGASAVIPNVKAAGVARGIEPSAASGLRGSSASTKRIGPTESVEGGLNEQSDRVPKLPQGALVKLLYALVVVSLLIFGWKFFAGDSEIEVQRIAQLRQAGGPAERQGIARAAVDGDEAARIFVVREATKQDGDSTIRRELLRVAFDTRWAGELSDRDLRAIMALSLAGIGLGAEQLDIPPLDQLHPAVSYAIAVDLPLSASGSVLSGIPIKFISKLPPPIGTAFDKLAALFASDPAVDLSTAQMRAFSKVLAGYQDGESYAALFSPEVDQRVATALLVTLVVDSAQDQTGWGDILRVVGERDDNLGRRIDWFEEGEVADWSKASNHDKATLAAGLRPSANLSLEQTMDLLSYPLGVVREDARMKLDSAFASSSSRDGTMRDIIGVLASEHNFADRDQVIALLSALSLPSNQGSPLIASWFSSNPDPTTVARLLAARRSGDGYEAFGIEAARYLKDREWQADSDLLRRLGASPEPLVRALVYSKLDPAKTEDRKLLEEFLSEEKNNRLHGELQLKVGKS